jgi:hypothetical protein
VWVTYNPSGVYIQAYESGGTPYCVAESGTGYELEECCPSTTCSTAQNEAQLFQFLESQDIQNVHSTMYMGMNNSGVLFQSDGSTGNLQWTVGQQWGTSGSASHYYAYITNTAGYMDNVMCLDVDDGDIGAGTTVDMSSYACEDFRLSERFDGRAAA